MWNGSSCYKRFVVASVFFLIGFVFGFSGYQGISFAESEPSDSDIEKTLNENIDEILNDIDTSGVDEYVYMLDDENSELFDGLSFKSLVLKIINGAINFDMANVFEYIKTTLQNSFKQYFSLIFGLFVSVIIYEIFNIFCADKYIEIKKVVEIVFSLQIALILTFVLGQIYKYFGDYIAQIFNFIERLFPIILGLLLLSGATGTHTITSTLSVFIINTGSYVFKFVLLPLSLSIVLISIFSNLSLNGNLQKISGILKSVFKTIIAIMFGIFGVFSTLNFIISGVTDGLSLKVTKYAIKNYIPILGGYISDGFDFVKTCSLLVKNGFGIVGILVLFYIVLKAVILNLIVYFSFKLLAVFSGLVGKNKFTNLFENFASSISYFFVVFIGLFLILLVFIFLIIVSVSVI